MVDGGPGYDRLEETGDASYTLSDDQLLTAVGGQTETDQVVDIQEANLTGGSSPNEIDGSDFSGRVFANGKGGDDTITGGDNADRLQGGAGGDQINGGGGNDVLRGQGGSGDVLAGGDGDDKLDGGIGNDDLNGD
ncbi:MAG: calcium-binding protein, partial [Planctomycetaceae bacterium]|nr:calcium-binding protein [Planctomycetaceae bacterium]